MSAVTVRPEPVADLEEQPVVVGPGVWVEVVVLTVAVALGALLRIRTRQDLWVDEALSVNISRLPPRALLEALRHNGHPPVYYLLLHGWMRVFGEGALAVRLLSTVLSLC